MRGGVLIIYPRFIKIFFVLFVFYVVQKFVRCPHR